jgi:hypothetical protein
MARQSSSDLHTLFDRFESVIRAHPQAAAQLAFQFGVWVGKGVAATRPGKKVTKQGVNIAAKNAAKRVTKSVTEKAAKLPRKIADAALRVIGASPVLQPAHQRRTRAARRPTRPARKTKISTTKRTTKNG